MLKKRLNKLRKRAHDNQKQSSPHSSIITKPDHNELTCLSNKLSIMTIKKATITTMMLMIMLLLTTTLFLLKCLDRVHLKMQIKALLGTIIIDNTSKHGKNVMALTKVI